MYQIGTDAAEGKAYGLELEIAAEGAAAKAEGGEERGAASHEGIEDEVAFAGGSEEDTFEEGDGLLRGCLPNFFSQDSGGGMVQTDFICLPPAISFMC